MTANDRYRGVWPVMLTPLTDRYEIDWDALAKLIDWYIGAGVHGLFADCQSSEMFYLSDAESVRLTRFVLQHTAGRVPVVASGHTATALSQQVDQLAAIASTGVDSVILISNRLAPSSADDAKVLANLQWLTGQLPASVNFGIYECPYPYKRLLSDEVVDWCAKSARFTFIKDTCCSIDTIRRRVALSAGSRLRIANANAQTLLASLQAGAAGYSGVMANFHPALYVWLCENWQHEPAKAQALANYLSTAALVESLDYPVCAKDYQCSIGNFRTAFSRARESGNYYSNHFQTNMQQAIRLGDDVRAWLGI